MASSSWFRVSGCCRRLHAPSSDLSLIPSLVGALPLRLPRCEVGLKNKYRAQLNGCQGIRGVLEMIDAKIRENSYLTLPSGCQSHSGDSSLRSVVKRFSDDLTLNSDRI